MSFHRPVGPMQIIFNLKFSVQKRLTCCRKKKEEEKKEKRKEYEKGNFFTNSRFRRKISMISIRWSY
jgi:hypothetical protein